MPTYLFYDKNSKREFEETMKISELDDYLAQNPHIEQRVNGAPMIGHNTLTRKPDSGFRDRLKEIKRKHIRSTVNTW